VFGNFSGGKRHIISPLFQWPGRRVHAASTGRGELSDGKAAMRRAPPVTANGYKA
jgi:hypothetical protein